jgi:hypothetical protein
MQSIVDAVCCRSDEDTVWWPDGDPFTLNKRQQQRQRLGERESIPLI